MTDWQNYQTTLNDDDYNKFYISEKALHVFYGGITENYTTTDANIGLTTEAGIGKIASAKEVRICDNEHSPNSDLSTKTAPLGDVYFEYVTPEKFMTSTYIFNSYKALIIYVSKADGSISVSGGGYYSNNSWKWRVSANTGIVLKPNTRYAFDFRVLPNSAGSPQAWNLEVTNLVDDSVQNWNVSTTYFPYNYRNKHGITTIACNTNVTAFAGGVLDLSRMIIEGQTSTYRPVVYNDEIVFNSIPNTVVLPRIKNTGDIHTYVVLNGVKTVNSTYDIDLSEYAKSKDVYTKKEIDSKGFVTEVPDFDIFATKEQFETLDSKFGDYALKTDIPQDLEELTNNKGYVVADEVIDIVTKLIPAEDIEKIKNITSYDDTEIKLDIEHLQSQVELLMSSKAEGDEVDTLSERVENFQKAEDDEITEIANAISSINIVEFND